ncbi:hypothetical protein [Cytobacillus gottheilii]|uniref:hypothetical protein n=1 Tax=Cytobacillus gottheilii TaxID=859144 RepID=UPI001C597CC8|nr:hypothetical protein [Cytobacillus gottheilii]
MILLAFIMISFVIGFVGVNHIGLMLSLMYMFSYLLAGVLAPIWNVNTPYFASFMLSVTLTVLNLLAASYLLNIMVLADPAEINSSFMYNTSLSLLATFAVVKIMEKRRGETHA